MANYNESTVTGTEYTRCAEIYICNPLGKTPSIRFNEERATVLTDRTITSRHDEIVIAFDPAKTIPLLNPETGEPLNTSVTFAEMYTYLYSAYIQAALDRDAVTAQQPSEP